MTTKPLLTSALLTLFTACAVVLPLMLTSCEHDSYDKGNSHYSQMQADFVEAHTSAAGTIDYVLTDNGDQLPLTSAHAAKWAEKADTLYRALLCFTRTAGGADVISLSRVSTARPHPVDSYPKGIKTDPVGLESVWLSGSHRYLNLGLILKSGTANGSDGSHYLAIVRDTIITNADGRTSCHISLYHDQAGVPQYYTQRTYFSIPLAEVSADTLVFRLNTYEGEIFRHFSLN